MGNIKVRNNPFSIPSRTNLSRTNRTHPTKKHDATKKAKELSQQPAGQPSTLRQHLPLKSFPTNQMHAGKAAEGIRERLKHKGVDPKLEARLASELAKSKQPFSESGMEQALERMVQQTPQSSDAAMPKLSKPERTELIQKVSSALEASKKEAEGLNGQGDGGSVDTTTRDMKRHVDAFHNAIQVSLGAAKQSTRVINNHVAEIDRRNKQVRQLLDLSDLMSKYEYMDQLDLSDYEGLSDLQIIQREKDYHKMGTLIQVAKEAGITWDCKGGWGWEDKTQFERFSKGVTMCIGALQSQNKVKDLQMQQAVQCFQALILLCTTLLLLSSQTKKSIIQNIVR